MIHEGQRSQWWLVELNENDNVHKMVDGAHREEAGAQQAYTLHQQLGSIKPGHKYAIVHCEVFDPVGSSEGIDKEAIQILNSLGIKP